MFMLYRYVYYELEANLGTAPSHLRARASIYIFGDPQTLQPQVRSLPAYPVF